MLSERIVTEYGGTSSAYNNQESGHFGKEKELHKNKKTQSLFKSNSQANGLT